MELDIEWHPPLRHRVGAEERLCGIDVFHDFPWREVFPDERTQFKNGKALAKFVKQKCANGKTPALLLTRQTDLPQGLRQSAKFSVFVVNIDEYRSAEGDAAVSYLATHLGVDITEIEQLQALAESADPQLLRAFIESSLDIDHIAEWALDNAERMSQLRELVGPTPAASLSEALSTTSTLADLSQDDLTALVAFLGTSAVQERRLELARAVTSDPTGRFMAARALGERTSQRIEDAQAVIDGYVDLLGDPATTETAMQLYIEENPWLLGLDYATILPRRRGPSGATDFLLDRFDGFQDLLELKSPQDPIVRAPSVGEGEAVPAPHEYALSSTLAQALAQALAYRDRLTRYAEAAAELYGLPHTRDPRLIVVIGRADRLSPDRGQVLAELNKSLHRVEVVPYDVLADRARAVLDNITNYFVASESNADAA